jgi:anthranilate synthase/aminodeoxychorismate synthase-like glutamine amidotransferase
MILLIDNYDSFVHNLARYVGILGRERKVVRNDALDLEELTLHPPEAIIISPGPCAPEQAGLSNDVIRQLGNRIPILGVCLGHQCIGEVYGGQTIRAPYPMHGKTSMVEHNNDGLFLGLPNPLRAARYHSLIANIPADTDLLVTAQTEDDRIIMSFEHKEHPVYGIQFHPESCLTDHGIDIIRNFLRLADAWNEKTRKAA